jgi:hypothetical protein
LDKQQGKEMYSFLQVSSRKDLQQQKMDFSWGPKKEKKKSQVRTYLSIQRKRVLKGKHAATQDSKCGVKIWKSWNNFKTFSKRKIVQYKMFILINL